MFTRKEIAKEIGQPLKKIEGIFNCYASINTQGRMIPKVYKVLQPEATRRVKQGRSYLYSEETVAILREAFIRIERSENKLSIPNAMLRSIEYREYLNSLELISDESFEAKGLEDLSKEELIAICQNQAEQLTMVLESVEVKEGKEDIA